MQGNGYLPSEEFILKNRMMASRKHSLCRLCFERDAGAGSLIWIPCARMQQAAAEYFWTFFSLLFNYIRNESSRNNLAFDTVFVMIMRQKEWWDRPARQKNTQNIHSLTRKTRTHTKQMNVIMEKIQLQRRTACECTRFERERTKRKPISKTGRTFEYPMI